MGLFSKRSGVQGASYSREWLAQANERPRKVELTVAVIARLARRPIGSASSWGESLDDGGLNVAAEILHETIRQDRSLVGHIVRDLTLVFETNGGIAVNRDASLESVGIESLSVFGDASGSPAEHAAMAAMSVARTIQARREGREAGPVDLETYRNVFEDRSDLGYERAIGIGCWSGLVVARLASADRLPNGAIFLEPGMDLVLPMEEVGWFPNPVNAGDTSSGDASIERWWDGTDWTDRVRFRDGQHWQEVDVSLCSTPKN